MKDVINSISTIKEVKNMKKALVILMAISMLFAMGSMALAKQDPSGAPGNIVSNEYTPTGHNGAAKDYRYFEEGVAVTSGLYNGSTPSTDNDSSTHVYGTWNSPYTAGIDGYNYNDAQDYVAKGAQVDQSTGAAVTAATAASDVVFTSGPHGGYLTSTHRCRECHAVHRAAGKFKLLRSDTRFEACDWCHGTGAGSGYNIQMDNDDAYTTEYNVGHTMGFGVTSGKWKAPDDTYPAFTPNYWQGGFSCFDCHSPHANPSRMLGFNDAGDAVGIAEVENSAISPQSAQVPTGRVFGIVNSGGDDWAGTLVKAKNPQRTNKPFWLSGSWLLIKNPDREIASTTTPNVGSGILALNGTTMANVAFDANAQPILNPETTVTITANQEIPDYITADLKEFDASQGYPVNKLPIDWNSPMGNARTLWMRAGGTGVTATYGSSNGEAAGFLGFNVRRSEALTTWGNTTAGIDKFSENYDADNQTAGYLGAACNVWSVSDFCTDCHDGNAGKHTVKAPLFSEDRALRNSAVSSGGDGNTNNDRANYDLAYGHDAQPRH